MKDMQDFDNMKILLASPQQIEAWSYGEVKKPETINYRTLRAEKEGLFCERIFGTTKEWECFCGKFKSIRYKGVICDRCGVEVTHFKVRRERMGHIKLASPVSHIWYYRSVPSRMGLVLDLKLKDLHSVLYYSKYIVIDPGDSELKKMQLLTEEELAEARQLYGMSFTAGIGAEAIRTLLANIDLNATYLELRQKMIEKGLKAEKRLLKRISIIEDFRDSGNRPEWMILDVIPVIPPELRPMVQLDGGRFATSDLNDLYRRVINRNNRLKKMIAMSAPDIMLRNEKRMLQEAVDALFDNSKKKRVVKGSSSRALKSLSDMLRGKQGRFRQNLLGKRVDYSGRSVIVVGPNLRMHQCGLPTKMALELFKPFLMKKLVEKDVVYNIKKAKTMVESESVEVFSILDEVVKEHPVLLNRAPTLHRLGIQAFEPVLVEGKAIRLHPLVCHAYNADFDGDQMAVHVPLTQAAQIECWTLMLSVNNLLNPANGSPIVFPSQDMVLGIHYLTRQKVGAKGEGKYFGTPEEVVLAIEAKAIDYQAECKVKYNGEVITTTPGRVIFNQNMPKEMEYVNEPLGDKAIKALIGRVYKTYGPGVTVSMLDSIKDLGFKYATIFGASISIADIIVPKEKKNIIDSATSKVSAILEQYHKGHITNEERYNRVTEEWSKADNELTNSLMSVLKEDQQGFNPLWMMADSGARGSRTQIKQLSGMRGLMAKPSGDIIELPIKSNFKEGLSIIEFFISTNGARKGLADTALKTAEAGYLTRRLVDAAQDVVVNEEDCGTINGLEVSAFKNGEEVVESLKDRIAGCFTLEQVKNPITGEILVDVNELIDDATAEKIEALGIEKVRIRTVLTCEAKHGVCAKCYGRNLASNKTVEIGEAVGIIAAQSIGQPGTQLTMRTFHVGGTATKTTEDNRVFFKYDSYVKEILGSTVTLDNGDTLFTRKGHIIVAKIVRIIDTKPSFEIFVTNGQKVSPGEVIARYKNEDIKAEEAAFVHIKGKQILLLSQDQKHEIRNGSELLVKVGDVVKAEETVATFDPYTEPIIAEKDGTVKYIDIVLGTTLKEEINEDTGNVERRISDLSIESLQPRIAIIDKKGNEIAIYYLPGNAYLNIEDGEVVKKGKILAKMLKESGKTSDITSGLPRVVDLFEARRPENAAILAAVGGTVQFKSPKSGKRIIMVVDPYGVEVKHEIPMGRHLLVRDGDLVEAGELLCSGNIDPHDILRIKGENALQTFLVNEVQAVYRQQGVSINDKHIGVIIRQMMRKVAILAVGDTNFIYKKEVDRFKFFEENERVIRNGGQPAVAYPILQGITRASVNIDSFLSAASFQETTKVLTNAAIAGSVDELRGLKENIIIGHKIPAGTGKKLYRNLKLKDMLDEDIELKLQETMDSNHLASDAQKLDYNQDDFDEDDDDLDDEDEIFVDDAPYEDEEE